MVKLSIIVPVYNVKAYLKQCLDSLIHQSLEDFEIIIVNDGSTDGSIEILNEYDDNRLKVIHQENAGLSAARNTGLKYAQGEYVCFVDSDDFISSPNAYKEMYDLAKKNDCDIVYGNATLYYNEDHQEKLNDFLKISPQNLSSEEFLMHCLQQKIIFVPVWLYFYRRSFINKNNFRFKPGMYHEDEEFTPRVVLKANKVVTYDKHFYMYRQREGSIMNTKENYQKGWDILNLCLEHNRLLTHIKSENLKKLFQEYIAVLGLTQIRKYKLKNLPWKYRWIIFKNSQYLRSRLKSLIVLISPSIFIKIKKG